MSTLLFVAAILAAVLLTSHLFWPHRICPPCEGTGRLLNLTRTAARICRRCNGRGIYPRLGTRLTTAALKRRRNRHNRRNRS